MTSAASNVCKCQCKCSPTSISTSSSLVGSGSPDNASENPSSSQATPKPKPKHIWFGPEWRHLFSESVYTELRALSTATPTAPAPAPAPATPTNETTTNESTGRFFAFTFDWDWDNRVGVIFYDIRCALSPSPSLSLSLSASESHTSTGEVPPSTGLPLTPEALRFLEDYSSAISAEYTRRLLALGPRRRHDEQVSVPVPVAPVDFPHINPDAFDARLVALSPCGGTSFLIGQIMNQIVPPTSASTIVNGFKKEWGRPVRSDLSDSDGHGWSVYLGDPGIFLDPEMRVPTCPNVELECDRCPEEPTGSKVEAHTFADLRITGTSYEGGETVMGFPTETEDDSDDASEYFTCRNSSVGEDERGSMLADTYDAAAECLAIQSGSSSSIRGSPVNDSNFRASIPPQALITAQVEDTDSDPFSQAECPQDLLLTKSTSVYQSEVQDTMPTASAHDRTRVETEDPDVALIELGFNLNYRPPVLDAAAFPSAQTPKRRPASRSILDSPRSFLAALGKRPESLLVGVGHGRVKRNRRNMNHP